jgi:preprotein translocase subunit SecA
MDRLSLPEDVPITHRLVTRAIANAQRQVEAQNFERRKNVLKYDEVMNRQREVIYDTRRRILEGEDLGEQTLAFLTDVVSNVFVEYAPLGVYPEEWDLDGLFTTLGTIYPVAVDKDAIDLTTVDHAELQALLLEDAERAYKQREAELGPELLGELERAVLLTVLDRHWREHLYEMDYLQEGIGLRAIGQRDPLVEYQREAFDMFQGLQETIKREAVAYVFNASIEVAEQAEEQRQSSGDHDVRLSSASTEDEARAAQGQTRKQKIGRNQPCWCGSGKKFKACHGAPGAQR